MIGPFLPARWIASLPDVGAVEEDVLPYMPGQTLLKKKEPEWATGTQMASSGRTRTTSYRAVPLWHFQLGYNAVRKRPGLDEWSDLVAFYNGRRGAFGEFRYFDRYDHLVTAQTFGTGDGATTSFQLCRGINGFVEPVYAIAGVDAVLVDGVANFDYTVGELGQITFGTAPALDAELKWSGAFFFLCRFDSDALGLGQPFSKIWDIKSLAFTSIKP